MKTRTDYFKALDAIKEQSHQELAEELNKRGGEWMPDEDGRPIILGSWKHADTTEDYVVTRVTVDEYGAVMVYGHPTESIDWEDYPEEDNRIYYLEANAYALILEVM